jgi:hypothetical protein
MAYAELIEGIRKEFYQQMKNANSKQKRDLIREPRVHICLKHHRFPPPLPDLITGQLGKPHTLPPPLLNKTSALPTPQLC